MFNAPNPGSEGRREWEDRRREGTRGEKKKGGVIRQVGASGDTVILCSPSAVGELVKTAPWGGGRNWDGGEGNAPKVQVVRKSSVLGAVSVPGYNLENVFHINMLLSRFTRCVHSIFSCTYIHTYI